MTSNSNIQEEIYKKYKKYKFKPSINKKTLKEICKPPNQFSHQNPQKFLAEFMSPKTKNKAILVFHQIGSGKTCTAINIAEQWKNKRKIWIILPASLIGNFYDELRSPCAFDNYMTSNERNKINNDNKTEIIEKTNERINKVYTILSYNKFISMIEENKVKLTNSLIIIDEIQNMISEYGTYYQKLSMIIKKSPEDLRIILLSATPIFDKPVELALTLNLLPLENKLPIGQEFNDMFLSLSETKSGIPFYKFINQDIFKNAIRGFVSYYRGMPKKSFPNSELHIVKCTMDSFQYSSYKVVQLKEKKASKIDLLKLPNNFFIGTRIISNIAYPNGKVNAKGYDSWKKKYLKGKSLKKYSIKFYKIIKNIRKSEGKIFVYSNFVEYGGLKPFKPVLEANGFIEYKSKMELKPNKKYFATWSGDESLEFKEEIKGLYNNPKSPLVLMLGSPAIKEGVTLKRVRQIHILEPYWNYSRLSQIIGRGIRFCSHADLPKKEQFVDIFLYLAVRPNENKYKKSKNILTKMSVDRYINYLAISKQNLIEEFENLLKKEALDCLLNKEINGVECS
jgi:superfamily II DNA or RNA helicase